MLFVDESKAKGHTMVAALIVQGDVGSLRKQVKSLVLPGQRRIHFTKESDSRKKAILSSLTKLGVKAHVFHCVSKNQALSREACLTALVAHAVEMSCKAIVLERDESIEQSDRRILFREVQRQSPTEAIGYDLIAPHLEPLLWIPDAIAWSFTKGKEWKPRVQPLISASTNVAL